MARLFIAEKKNLGIAIAEGLGIARTAGDHIECRNGDLVTWAAGHLLEMLPPDAQDERWKSWSIETLPIFPKDWRKKDQPGNKAACFKAIKRLLSDPRVTRVVNAGDPDREGQLIVDELLEYLRCSKPVDRILAGDLSKNGVKRALETIRPNSEFKSLYDSALCRERADYALGMSATRALTVLARSAGANVRVLSFGRVQTPTLSLVVNRQKEIDNFVSKPYWALTADVGVKAGNFSATWVAPEGCPALDEEGRLCDKVYAEKVLKRVGKGPKNGRIRDVEKKAETEQPPRTFDLTSFQGAMAKYGVKPGEALEIAQELYNKKFTSYPRSAHDTLPATQLADAPEVLKGILAGCAGNAFKAAVAKADPKRRSGVWLDKFTAEHHAIIPTGVPAKGLTGKELIGYMEIAARYVYQFLPPMEGERTVVLVDAGPESDPETFRATGLVPQKLGWREFAVIEGLKSARKAGKKKTVKRGEEDEEESDGDDEDDEKSLPQVVKGELADVEPKMAEKKTTPPKPFTQTSLVKAMQKIGLYVEDPQLRKLLLRKDIQGIGTVATRAEIVKGLLAKGLMQEIKGKLRPTPEGTSLIENVTGTAFERFMKPEITAVWEQTLEDMKNGKGTLSEFMKKMEDSLTKAVAECRTMKFEGPAAVLETCPYCGERTAARIKGKFGWYFKCSACGKTARDEKGKPVAKAEGGGAAPERRNCPICGLAEMLVRLPLRAGGYKWHCESKPCGVWIDDKDGEPSTGETEKCPKCSGTVMKRTAKSGKVYWGCAKCGTAFFSEAAPDASTPCSEPSAAPKRSGAAAKGRKSSGTKARSKSK